MDVINLTHYDLDGVVCHILLKNLFNVVGYYTCGYGKSDTKIEQSISIYENERIIVTDLSLTKKQYEKLYDLDNDLIYIDHHESSLIELKDEKINGIIDVNISAAALLFYYYKKEFKALNSYEGLKNLAYFTNFYDTWQTNKTEFNTGYQLNEIFNIMGWNNFVKDYRFGFYNISDQLKSKIKSNVNDKIKLIKSGLKYVFDDEDAILLIYEDGEKLINDTTLLYKNYKYYFVVSLKLNKISLRIRGDKDISKVFDDLLKDDDNIISYGGHAYAGSFILKETNQAILEKYVNKIYYGLKNGQKYRIL